MIANPRPGRVVQIWYNQRVAPTMPLHGKIGIVAIASRGKPRNHGVMVDGVLWVVPCGNLRNPPDATYAAGRVTERYGIISVSE